MVQVVMEQLERLYKKIEHYYDINRLIKLITPKYVIENGLELGGNSAKVVTDAYVNNNLVNLGLPFSKDPFDLNVEERKILLKLR